MPAVQKQHLCMEEIRQGSLKVSDSLGARELNDGKSFTGRPSPLLSFVLSKLAPAGSNLEYNRSILFFTFPVVFVAHSHSGFVNIGYPFSVVKRSGTDLQTRSLTSSAMFF